MGRGKRLGVILAVTILLGVFPVIGAACSPKEKNVETTEINEKSDIKGMPYKMVISPDNNKVTLYDNIYFKNTMESDTESPEQTIVNFSVVTKEDIEGNDIWRFDNNIQTKFAGMAYIGDSLVVPYSYDFQKSIYSGDIVEQIRGLERSGGVFVLDNETGELVKTLTFPDDRIYHPYEVTPASDGRIAVRGYIYDPKETEEFLQFYNQEQIQFIATFTLDGLEALKVFTLGPDTLAIGFHEYHEGTFLYSHKLLVETEGDPHIYTNFSLFQPKDGKFEFIKGWVLENDDIDLATIAYDGEDVVYGMLESYSDFVRIRLPDYDPESEGYTVVHDSLEEGESIGSNPEDFHFYATSVNDAEVISFNRIGIYGADWKFQPEKVKDGYLIMVSQLEDLERTTDKYISHIYFLDTEGNLVDTYTLTDLEGEHVVGVTHKGKTYYTGVRNNVNQEQHHEEWFSFTKPLKAGVWELPKDAIE